MKTITKVGIGVAAAAAIAATGALVFAWGPSRPTYTMKKPADHVVFNSITDNNQEVGDERYFVSASPYTGKAADNKWTDSTAVENGKEYVVRMYVHNDAASNLKLTAENVRAYIVLPTETATSITVNGKIYSSNANPTTVWDQTTFTSKNGEKFNLAYVKGTAKYYNTKNGKERVFNLDTANNDLFTSKGVLLGYDQMDGKIPGCIEYSGYLTFHVKAQFAEKNDIEITKEVKKLGTDTWSESVEAKSGDTVRYRIHFKNTGNTTLKNVIIRDILPTGLTYVKGTTEIFNTAHPKGVTLSDKIVTDSGINLGDYAAEAGAWIYFNATVDQGISDKCSNTILRNVVQANGGHGTKEDTADVRVTGKTCSYNFTLDKKVQISGTDTWSETVAAKAGNTVRYRIAFKNTGNTTLNNVIIKDTLPKNITYVAGSTYLGSKKVADGVTTDGINIGSVEAGKTAYVYFNAKVSSTLSDNCEDSTLTNTVKGYYNKDDKTAKTDTAVVTVAGKTCTSSFTIDKKVQNKGDSAWAETVTTKAGNQVRYRIAFKNTGNMTLNNVVIKDTLPANVSYINGTTYLGDKKVADGVTADGINIGSVEAGKTVYVYFNATVAAKLGDSCNDSTLTNTVKGYYNNDTKTAKTDTAVVKVNGKVCNSNFTINKQVQLDGGSSWSESVAAKAGDKVRYRIQFKNTGDFTLKNVEIHDILPANMTYVKGTTILYNSANANGKTLSDDIVSKNGVNIGDYAKGAEATIYFYATVDKSLADNCEGSTLTNKVNGQYNNDASTAKTDTADVTVAGKTCEEPELPETGAGNIITTVAGVASVATAAGYYIASRKKIN